MGQYKFGKPIIGFQGHVEQSHTKVGQMSMVNVVLLGCSCCCGQQRRLEQSGSTVWFGGGSGGGSGGDGSGGGGGGSGGSGGSGGGRGRVLLQDHC